jgi:hypothetical protein
MTAKATRKQLSPAWILFILTGLNLFNYLDRFVLSAVLTPLQKNLGINDGHAEGKTVKAAKRPFVCDILTRNSRISVVVSGRPQIGGTARNTAEAASLPAHFL